MEEATANMLTIDRRLVVIQLSAKQDVGGKEKLITELIKELKTDFPTFMDPLLTPFLIVQGGTRGDPGLALTALAMRVQMLVSAKELAEIEARLPSMDRKTMKKIAKPDRTRDDEEVYTYLKVCGSYYTEPDSDRPRFFFL